MNTHTHWTTRPETTTDIESVRRINVAAFETAEEADLVDALRQDPAWIDGLSMLTLDDDGAPVGHALLTRCHIGDTPALCLAPCAVYPEYQRTGAGSAAIRAVLDAARQRGEHFVTVLGHPDYYPRFGFTRASEHGVRMNVEVPDDALMVLALDGRPIPSGAIRYAAAFGDI
ncbi:N-acetyltransferase [Rhodococcus hoagii]|nr:N-acetyltransferase [Prescottella equi]